MTDKDAPDDEEDESVSGESRGPGATQGQFGGDLESLPGKRTPPPTPRAEPTNQDFDLETLPGKKPAAPQRPAVPKPPATEIPTREIDVEREMPTIVGSFAGSTPGESQRTPRTEVPTKEIEDEREMPTIVGDFASATSAGATEPPDAEGEAETMVEGPPSAGSEVKSARGTPATGAPGRPGGLSGRAFKSPLSKGSSRTARDPIVGTAAMRGTQAGGALGETKLLAEGQLLADRYELVERLGKGGMGEVWKARHILLQGMRAIKVIKASISRDPAFRQRFLKEGQTMMRVKHPGVVEVTDLDETRSNRELFMVMEYLKGRTIYEAVRDKETPLAADVRNAARVLREVALGMQRIHDERIVHKDLKSDNVLLVKGDDGLEFPKVIDFGLAKSMGDEDVTPEKAAAAAAAPHDPDLHTTLSGTLAYMAPEQFRHEPSSFRSDIYAFGVMAYEVFTAGEYPLPRGPLAHYLDLHKQGTRPDALSVKRPDLDPALAAIFDRCMAVDKAARPESFRDVAKDLQYWLDTPERLARKKRVIYVSAAAAALVAAAVWGVFFAGEKTAGLSNLALSAGGKAAQLVGRTYFLGGDGLARFEVTAAIEGKPGVAVLEIDGRAYEVTGVVEGGRFVARADLSGLGDGPHDLALKPSPGASASLFAVDVDRVAPRIRGVAVKGAVSNPAGVFTNAQSPEVVIHVDEAADRIASVVATPANAASPIAAQRDAGRWLLLGTAPEDGRVDLDVAVRDHAGNESRTKFSYVRDTKAPAVTLVDEFTSENGTGREVRVRPAARPKLIVEVKDAAAVETKFGDAAPVVLPVERGGAIEIDVPATGDAGVATSLTVRDVAGNETVRTFVTRLVPDHARLTDGESKGKKVLGQHESFPIVILRKYPVGEGFQLTATMVRDAAGAAVADAVARRVEGPVVNTQSEGCVVVVSIDSDGLDEGTYRVSAILPGEARVEPYELTIDRSAPEIAPYTIVERSSGREVPAGGFALEPELVVKAVVADLSPSSMTLAGQAADETPGPGRRTYTFRVKCDREGPNTWPLVVQDGARNAAQRAVGVKADWSTPSITVTSPSAASNLDDRTQTVFRGACPGESDYDVKVELPGGKVESASFQDGEFAVPVMLPGSDRRLAVSIFAVDRAGHRSPPVELSLNVVHVETELKPEIVWSRTITATMEKVDPGDVVIGGRVRPVARVYVDRTEVTNRDYRAFLAATNGGRDSPRHPDEPKGWDRAPSAVTWSDAKWNADDLPVVNVAYWDAWSFAKWSGRRLPTEAEWVKAAAKSKSPDEAELRAWPPFGPGEPWKNGVVVTAEWAKGPLAAGTGGDVSPVGCLHMGGNVSEWVDLPADVAGATAGTRGGSWYFSRVLADVRRTPAKAWDRSFRANTIGFRCAVDATQVEP